MNFLIQKQVIIDLDIAAMVLIYDINIRVDSIKKIFDILLFVENSNLSLNRRISTNFFFVILRQNIAARRSGVTSQSEIFISSTTTYLVTSYTYEAKVKSTIRM